MRLLYLLLMGFFTTAAASQELPPPDITIREITSSGNLTGCSIEFTVAFKDRIYKQGALAAATGSINLFARQAQPGMASSFKFVGLDFEGQDFKRFKVSSASLFAKNGKPHKVIQVPCEDENAYCAAMPADAYLDTIANIADAGKLRMAFNRKQGAMDVPIEFEVSPEHAIKLIDCAQSLTEGIADAPTKTP